MEQKHMTVYRMKLRCTSVIENDLQSIPSKLLDFGSPEKMTGENHFLNSDWKSSLGILSF